MYFEQKLERITIGDKTFPVKIDMYVLEKIQEKYGNINDFELKLKGLQITDETDDTGKRKYNKVEPSIGTINFVLPLMVREGCSIEGVDLPDVTDKEIVQNVRVPYMELQRIIASEFDKCFETEKK